MTTTHLRMVAPLASPLPPAPAHETLTPSQWMTLMAVVNTVIPTITSSSGDVDKLCVTESEYQSAWKQLEQIIPGDDWDQVAKRFLDENASTAPGFQDAIQRQLTQYITRDAQKGLKIILSALDTRAGCLLMTGSTTSLHQQSVNERQRVLQSWSTSYLPPLRSAARAFEQLAIQDWLLKSATLGPTLGFPRYPIHGKPGKGYDYSFLQFAPCDQPNEPEIISTDVVIIGSGCGGAVCAKTLAEAGHRVIVADKAYHFPPEHLPMSEHDAGIHLFHNGGLVQSDDQSIAVIAGNAWGGGGTINWSASLQTQGFVRQEWADSHGGLPFFTSAYFQECLDRVCERMGVSGDHVEHNKTNRVLMEGARKLGYSCKVVPQNTGGKKHYCGYCTLGCGSAEKQGPVASFLPDAARAGAQFIEGFTADKVLFDNVEGKKIATGVQGRWRSRDGNRGVSGPDRISRSVVIQAKRVIVSCGTLASPLLLLRSGLTNPQIGRNLYLHPASFIGATFPVNHPPINPWEGPILSTVVDSFQNLDNAGHGAKLEATAMLPSWFIPCFPWRGGLDTKLLAAKLSRSVGYISMVREKFPGRVYADPPAAAAAAAVDGNERCRIEYTVSKSDRAMALEGLMALARILYVEGAEEIFFGVRGWPTFSRSSSSSSPSSSSPSSSSPSPSSSQSSTTTTTTSTGINDPHFQSFLATCRRRGLTIPETTFASAHQMGTCRMSARERDGGVVDPCGKVYGVDEGLYVCDASVFPSASGVNPMVTNMAISDMIGRGVVEGLRPLRKDGS